MSQGFFSEVGQVGEGHRLQRSSNNVVAASGVGDAPNGQGFIQNYDVKRQ